MCRNLLHVEQTNTTAGFNQSTQGLTMMVRAYIEGTHSLTMRTRLSQSLPIMGAKSGSHL